MHYQTIWLRTSVLSENVQDIHLFSRSTLSILFMNYVPHKTLRFLPNSCQLLQQTRRTATKSIQEMRLIKLWFPAAAFWPPCLELFPPVPLPFPDDPFPPPGGVVPVAPTPVPELPEPPAFVELPDDAFVPEPGGFPVPKGLEFPFPEEVVEEPPDPLPPRGVPVPGWSEPPGVVLVVVDVAVVVVHSGRTFSNGNNSEPSL